MRWLKIVLLMLLVSVSGCKEEKLALGEAAPALAAFDLQGNEASLQRWQGKGIYLNFWSSGCGGCLAEMDTLQALSQQWKDEVVVVAVNTDPDSVSVASLLAKHHISYPVLRDQLKITQERYQVIGTPTSILIDNRGQVVDVHQGVRAPSALQDAFVRLAKH